MGDNANQLPPEATPRLPLSTGANPDAYEAGTVTGVSATGRYKSFAASFTVRPIVTISPMRGAGSNNAVLYGTPNVGSFRVRMDRVGSTMLGYIAIGRR